LYLFKFICSVGGFLPTLQKTDRVLA